MSEVSDWKTIDIENVRIDNLTLSAPQGSYWQKMMGAVKRMFGAVDERVTALEQAGGGGGEELFQKVYETTLTEASESNTITITNADMDGSYVDAVVYAVIPGDGNLVTLEVNYLSSGDDYIGSGSVSLEGNSTLSHVALISFGGLALILQDGFQVNSGKSEHYIGFSNDQAEYPTQGIAGIASIELLLYGIGETQVFPASTTITVYARRKVTAVTGGE